jgi:hypothetical protein
MMTQGNLFQVVHINVGLLQKSCKNRMSIEEALKHPWIVKNIY